MAQAVVLNLPLHGHINPTLPVIQELVHRGMDVVYYATEEFRPQIEQTGAQFQPYRSSFSSPEQLLDPKYFPLSIITECLHVMPQVLEQVRALQPDVILYDSMAVAGRYLSQVLDLPAIRFCPSYVEGIDEPPAPSPDTSAVAQPANVLISHGRIPRIPLPATTMRLGPTLPPNLPQPEACDTDRDQPSGEQMAAMQQQMRDALHELATTYSLPPIDPQAIAHHVERLNLVFLPRAFLPESARFDERFVFIGPSIIESAASSPSDEPRTQPTLYISLGTVFNREPEFFEHCREAFGHTEWQVVLATGSRVDPVALGPWPANFLVSAHVPQLEVLRRADLCITHGGMNSTMEALYYGVPLIVIPQMAEQATTARRIVDLGLGLALEKQAVTAAALRDAVASVRHDMRIQQHVAAMQQQVRAAGGYQRAASVISEYVTAHTKPGRPAAR